MHYPTLHALASYHCGVLQCVKNQQIFSTYSMYKRTAAPACARHAATVLPGKRVPPDGDSQTCCSPRAGTAQMFSAVHAKPAFYNAADVYRECVRASKVRVHIQHHNPAHPVLPPQPSAHFALKVEMRLKGRPAVHLTQLP